MNKTDRILDLIDHPENYTDSEIDEILSDPESAEIYKVLSRMQDAFYNVPQPDIDAEWNQFAASHSPAHPHFLKFFTRHAAAILIIVLASAAAVAAGFGLRAVVSQPTDARPVEQVSIPASDTSMVQNTDTVSVVSEPAVVIFKENTLAEILRDVTDYYNCSLDIRKPSSGSLRLYFKWDQSQSLEEVVEMLNNFDHINISLSDNTLTVE